MTDAEKKRIQHNIQRLETELRTVLTEDEAILFLRLDLDNGCNPSRTLKYYRDTGQLIAIQIGKKLRYRRDDLLVFLAQKSEKKRGVLAQ